MFKFKGISSKDMQVVVEEEEHFIAKASQRYEMTEIEGRDGAIFDELGYSVVERPIYVQCLNINKIDDILAWLNGEGELEYKGRKTTARFYSQLEPQRSSCIRIIDTTFIRDPFWCKVNEDYQLVKDRKDKKASGEYIHVEDSSNCRARIGISGNHEQETREGYNLLDLTSLIGKTETKNGVTYKINEDCSITVNGTPTDYISFNLLDMSLKAGTYKFVDELDNINNVFLQTIGDFQHTSQNNTFSLAEDGKATVYLVILVDAPTLNNATLYPMIYEGTEDKPYEQYGAMPSPDYISSIVAVGSNSNELENTAKTQTIKDVTFTVNEDGTVVANGTASQQVTLVLTKVLSLQKGDYMISGCPRGGTTSTYRIDVWKSDWSSLGFEVGNGTKISLSESIENAIVGITITKGTTVENMVFKPKIEKGKVATPWSPHGQGCVKVTKCNKNILKNIATSGALNGVTRTVNEDKSVTINGTSTGWANLTVGTIKGDGNSYTLSGSLSNSEIFLSVNNSQEGDIAQSKNGNEITFIPKRGLTYNVIICIPSGKTFNNVLIKPLVRISSDKDNTYEQHEEQSYIMPTQKEMLKDDYFDFENEEEVHMWGKYTFIGEEDYQKSQTYSNDEYLCAYIPTPVINNIKIDGKGLSSHFNRIGDFTTYQNEECVRTSGQLQIRVLVSRLTENSVEGLKAYLKSQYDAGTPVVVYYQLATPTRLKFTDEQKAVAKELNNARTYKNVTNITTDSKAILSLDYFTVTDEKIKNEGNVQSRPILRLEKTVSEAVDITINGVRFKYNFNNDKYVEIDCENKEVKFDGLERFRSIEIGYDFPKLNIGNNEITINDGDCIIKVIRKDRWL